MGKSDLDIKPEDWLFDVLKRDLYKEIVIFLGAGASMEGKLNGKPYPGFKKLIEEILTNVSTDWKYAQSSSSEEKFLKFKNIIKQWEKEGIAPKQLSIFLDGEPGPAHFYLAAITIVLYRYYNISSIHITTNYDDLMSKAFSDLERNKERSYLTKYFPLLRHITGSELKRFYANINQHIKDGVPVILKLFGDLHSQNPIFEKEDMTFEPETENQLNKWLECPIIFIGYSFQDLIIKELLISANSSAPVFVVDPKADILNLELSKRKIFTIKKSFSNFILDFLEVIQKKDLKNYEKITEILKPLTFQIQYPNVDYLNLAIRLGSKPSLLRVKEKLPKIAINENILPIDRKETAPDFQKFIEQVCPLMVIVGDSGMGITGN
ncbi:MAG: SIR2 family protein [Acidobacteria bacterium]|nr:SIR2 family protein [Acidobacteriota bacterium]